VTTEADARSLDLPTYLDALNPEQREAVEHFEGPLLVLAGAGSGKTRVLTARICHLIHHHGVAPDRILAVTFTNKAADEMKGRIARLLGGDPAGLWCGTFHALGAWILRRHAPLLGWSRTFTIYDQDQSLRLLKKTQAALDVDPKRWRPQAIRSGIGGAKNNLISPQEFVEENEGSFDLFARQVAKVYPEYQNSLKEQNAFDFDDLLVKPVELFRREARVLEEYRSRFQFLLVDEYQDTNHAQFKLLELLSKEHGNLMVVGDDDQSIYGWRGADLRNILDFEETFPGARVVRLERNYRSTERILEAANAVIRQNVHRKGKTLRTERTGGEPLTVVETRDEKDEARWIVDAIERRLQDEPDRTTGAFAVLYRTNAQSRALEDAFRRAGLPYQIVGGVRFYERREIQDVLAYLRLISNPLDAEAFERAVAWPRRGVGRVTRERLARFAEGEGVSPLEAAERATEGDAIPTGGARSLERFAERIRHYETVAAKLPVGELLEDLVEELEILRHLREEGPEGEDRAENVMELIAGAHEFEAEEAEASLVEEGEEESPFTELDLFLQRVALVAAIDRHDPDADAVTLMTLHNAKGLEFPFVFIAGMEDGLFPLGRAYDEPAELEEERRLFYVGLTRAEEKIFLTHARRRRRAGEYMHGRISSFVEAVPPEFIEERVSPRLAGSAGKSRGFSSGRSTGSGPTEASRRGPASGPEGSDEAFNQDLPRLLKGERVAHPTFGSGTVLEVTGSGRDMKVTVRFDTVGRKKLLVRYAGLEKDF